MEADDLDSPFSDDDDEDFNQSEYLYRLIFPNDKKYNNGYGKTLDGAKLRGTKVVLESLYPQFNKFENWGWWLPLEIRSMIIGKMDYITRFSLMFTSRSNYYLARSVPMVINRICVTKRSDLYNFEIDDEDEEHICIKLPPENFTYVFFIKKDEDTEVVRCLFDINTNELDQKTMVLKNCDYFKESESFVENLLGLAKYRLNELSIKVPNWGLELKIFDKVEVYKSLRLFPSTAAKTVHLLNSASSSLNGVTIGINDSFETSSFWSHNSIKNAQSLMVVAPTPLTDSCFLDLNFEQFCTSGVIITDHAINTFLKKWINGECSDKFNCAEIQGPRAVPNPEILRDIDVKESFDHLYHENKNVREYAMKTFAGMEFYFIESKVRNMRAHLNIGPNNVSIVGKTSKRAPRPTLAHRRPTTQRTSLQLNISSPLARRPLEMSQLTVTSYPPPVNEVKEKTDPRVIKNDELVWVQETRLCSVLNESIENIKQCCLKLNLSAKCDIRLKVPLTHTTAEKYNLVARQGGSDHLKASVTLLDDNVIQAEVTVKHPKAGGGFYRGVAQPDVQWKLQQMQDLGNHVARVSVNLCDLKEHVMLMLKEKSASQESSNRVLEDLKSVKNEVILARSSIQLPRKRSLLELCYFPPTRKFVPPLPQDQLLSFYISSCRLVCASYQMVPKTVHPQGLSVFMAECQLPYLDDVLKRLNNVMNSLQKMISYIEMLQF